MRGIENCLCQSNFLPILTDAHKQRSRFERYLETMLDRRIEGLILLANWRFLDINLIADLTNSGIPIISIGSELRTDSVSSVIVDNESGGRLALEHFCSLGHREIAFIRGPKSLSDSLPGWKGARSFAQSNGLELNSRLIMELPDSSDAISSFEVGYKLTEELIKRNRKFAAIMAFDDLAAFGTIRALAKAGIRVPEQCSVIGFDDIAPAALYTPALTTVRQPMESMGTTAVNIIVAGINSLLEKREVGVVHRRLHRNWSSESQPAVCLGNAITPYAHPSDCTSRDISDFMQAD